MTIQRLALKPRRRPLKIHQSEEAETRKSLLMIAGSSYIPKDMELKPLGEDAHFIYADKQVMGVADGVGGWAHKGVDAGFYARELMHNAAVAIHEDLEEDIVDLQAVLDEAFLKTNVEGSATACLLSLQGNILHALNVGDSGFILIRNEKVVFHSPAQQHDFNTPYQLGRKNDTPESAQEMKIQVKSGDIVVAGSDGLVDNVYSCDIRNLVSTILEDGYVSPGTLAFNIAKLALENSRDTCGSTPFSDVAAVMGVLHTGGKVDDITVLVAYMFPED